ncbi:hypothetical protein [Halorussus pelagicus]|uniref:hypothetical protein n=1 Tax=Halorussus pelagicus TaxID=2505977 RepID=UPI000FFB1349|nr:hypothetical protein [Halorussus pelagicus]
MYDSNNISIRKQFISKIIDIQIIFREGPLEAEVSAAEDEDDADVLEALGDFVESYDAMGIGIQQETTVDPTEGDTADELSTDEHTTGGSNGRSNSLFDEVNATDTELQRVLKTGRVEDDEIKEFPEILEDTDLLGTSVAERILTGAAVVLTFRGCSRCFAC